MCTLSVFLNLANLKFTPSSGFRFLQILAASVVTAHQGQQAVALAAIFSAHTLPCVVYIPPNCADHTTEQCRFDSFLSEGHDSRAIRLATVGEVHVAAAPWGFTPFMVPI